jgi:hypothetical protein
MYRRCGCKSGIKTVRETGDRIREIGNGKFQYRNYKIQINYKCQNSNKRGVASTLGNRGREAGNSNIPGKRRKAKGEQLKANSNPFNFFRFMFDFSLFTSHALCPKPMHRGLLRSQ